MARDFASRQHKSTHIKQTQEQTAASLAESKNRGAVPRVEEAPAMGRSLALWAQLPAWGWLCVGLIGGFLLAELRPQPNQITVKPTASVAQTTAGQEVEEQTATKAAPVGKPAPRFDFYTLLPTTEMEAPKIEAYKSTPRTAANQPRFMVQVGSFRTLAEAERLQHNLQQQSFSQIQISSVEATEGSIWYRVQLGPYQDRRELARTQNSLANAGFDFIQLRLNDEPAALNAEMATP